MCVCDCVTRSYNCFPCFSNRIERSVRSGVLMCKNVSSAIIRFESIYGNATIPIFHRACVCVCVSYILEVDFYLVKHSKSVCVCAR